MATKQTAVAQIPEPKFKDMFLTVKNIPGVSLICHNWAEKSKQEMLDKQMGKAQNKKAPKDPHQDYVDSLYWLSKKPANATDAQIAKANFGFPSVGFKSAAVTACTSVGGMTKVAARQAFHVIGEYAEIQGEPRMREDMVRIGMGTADIRFRGEFRDWKAQLHIQFNSSVITPEQVVHLFNTAGFAVGVGEWRPEKDGSNGLFRVDGKVQVEG
jgi:hypothetical protein